MPGVVAAMQTSEQIRDAMLEIYTINPYREILTEVLGPDHPHLELLAELAPAIIVHRTLFDWPLDPATFGDDVLALVHDLAASRD